MKRFFLFALCLLLCVSCVEKEPAYRGAPALQLKVVATTHTTATILIESLNTDSVYLLCTNSETVPLADEVLADGIPTDADTVYLSGLIASTKYYAYAVGLQGKDKRSSVVCAEFSTGIIAGDLYSWEAARGEVKVPADITLCTGGGVPNSNAWFSIPQNWDAARFAPHVSFEDGAGEHWLFDAFLAISGTDASGNNYGINNNGRISADKASWENFASYWLDKGGAFDELDKAVSDVARRIGNPPSKRQVVMMAPDPVMFERFTDKNSSTTYWGTLDGNTLDFSKIDDQIKSYTWYADLCRKKFNDLAPKHLELVGFYILSEELVAKTDGWNYQYKRWDRILPPFGEYLNERNEGLFWIPYRKADGTDMWQDLGINFAWLQPNYYWDYNNDQPISGAFPLIKQWGMGIELEFEYSMVEEVMNTPGIMGPDGGGNYVFTLKDVPSLRARFREYMNGYKSAGLYGKKPVALYSGSNAMYQLGMSKNASDNEIYLELCRFIADNPLKKK